MHILTYMCPGHFLKKVCTSYMESKKGTHQRLSLPGTFSPVSNDRDGNPGEYFLFTPPNHRGQCFNTWFS